MNQILHKLPKGISLHRHNWTYRFRQGGRQRRVILCPEKTPLWGILKAYDEFSNGRRLTVNTIIDEYLESHIFKRLKPSTQRDYEGAIKQIRPVFGKMNPSHLKSTHIQKYMNKRSSQKRANVERTVLMNVYKWAVSIHDEIAYNPAKDTIPFQMKARDRRISKDEFWRIYRKAAKPVRVAMCLSYLLGARQGDILKIKWSDVTDEGIYIKQDKTSKEQLKLMNDSIKKVLSIAKRASRVRSLVYVVSNQAGQSYTSSGFRSMWKKAKLKANIPDVTFHDIKAMSISNYEGDKQFFSGHKTRSMMERYNRTPDKVKSGEFK